MITSTAPARLILVGVLGFGRVHAERIDRLAEQGLVELVAAVDPGVVLDPPSIYGVPLYTDLTEALAATVPVDVVIIAAPLAVVLAAFGLRQVPGNWPRVLPGASGRTGQAGSRPAGAAQ